MSETKTRNPDPNSGPDAWAAGLPDTCTHGEVRLRKNGGTYCQECGEVLTCRCGKPVAIDGVCSERYYYGTCGAGAPKGFNQYMGD